MHREVLPPQYGCKCCIDTALEAIEAWESLNRFNAFYLIHHKVDRIATHHYVSIPTVVSEMNKETARKRLAMDTTIKHGATFVFEHGAVARCWPASIYYWINCLK
jgi:hypothetical protein